MIELLTGKDPWIATTSGERLLFSLLHNHSDWPAVVGALKNANVQMARRCENLTNFFVGASILHLQQRLIRHAQDVRELHPFDRNLQVATLSTRAQDVVGLGPAGTVRVNAPTSRRSQEPLAAAHAKTSQASQSVPLFQFVT